MTKVAVLASGSGTIFQSILGAGLSISYVAADRPCRALEVARDARIRVGLLDRSTFGGFSDSFDRLGYTKAMTELLLEEGVGLVAMAGFGTVLDQPIHDAFSARIMNTHPSLLPAFPGWHAVRDALASGAKKTGCTVHVATLEMDEGPILAQQSVVVEESDTEDSLHERIKQIERTLYPETIERALLHLGAGESLLTMQPLLEGDRG